MDIIIVIKAYNESERTADGAYSWEDVTQPSNNNGKVDSNRFFSVSSAINCVGDVPCIVEPRRRVDNSSRSIGLMLS